MMFGHCLKMKHVFFIALLMLCLPSYPQTRRELYEAQSNKINGLLNDRKIKFDQYQSSLSQRSGIFGSKTKKDMQSSIDMLTEIVETDNAIMRETQILLNYVDIETSEVGNKANDIGNRIKAFKAESKKLQIQNAMHSLREELLQKQIKNYNIGMFIFGLIGLGLLLFGFRRK